MASNLENLSNHFTSSALISSIEELDDLEEDFILAGSLLGVALFFSAVMFSVDLPLTCPRIWTVPGSTREGSELVVFFSSLVGGCC